MVDADTQQKLPAFDHNRLADSLSRASGRAYSGTRLPFNNFTFNDALSAIEMTIDGARWTCTLADYACRTAEVPPPGEIRRGISGPVRGDLSAVTPRPRMSPDGKWMAFIDNYNVAIRPFGGDKRMTLSTDGSEGNYYDGASLVWSPDSSKLAAYRIRPGYRRLVHYVASSPEDQLQPEHWAAQYAKPGDQLDLEQPVLFDVRSQKQIPIDSRLFPNPYDMSDLVWRKDSRGFTFEYNQRGHQVFRVIEVDAQTGAARAIISEEPKTFFYYNRSAATLQAGKRYRYDLADGKEIVWMSERDGWNHLYLIDGATGAVKGQITKGAWPVRHVIKVDEEKRQLWFSAGGMTPAREGKDPYFQHYYRINLDGTGLMPLTSIDANHTIEFSSDMTMYVDHYSRVDLPSVLELHRLESDGFSHRAIAEIDKGDITALVKAGWKAPEVFVAKGRDGVTDIWGLVWKPSRFDPSKKYPVIEYIYAGPHGTHTPKSFRRRAACRRKPSSASSSSRWTAWARRTARRRFTTSRGRTSRMPASPIASSGTRRSPRRTRGTTSRASASTAARRAARIRWARCSSIPSSTRSRSRMPAVTTIAWTRSGGTSSGWAGRSARSIPLRQTSITRICCRASCC